MVIVRTFRARWWHRGFVWPLGIGCLLLVLSLCWPERDRFPWFQRLVLGHGVRLVGSVQWIGRHIKRPWESAEARDLRLLHSMVAAQRAALAAAEEVRLERDRLRALLGLAPTDSRGTAGKPPGMVAQVIAHDPRAAFKTVAVNRGTADGVRKGMIAVAGAGLVGRVEQVAMHQATILLCIDPNHAVDVWGQRSRVRGLLVGSGRSTLLHRLAGVTRLEYLAETADLLPGDVVVTTGLDGRYPKGIPVGTIRTVRRGSPGLYTEAEVVPFVDWGAVEEILLLEVPS